jgi:hypothetical protein
MFKRGRYYDHAAFLDVAFHVLNCFFVETKQQWKLRVRWVNKRNGTLIADDKLNIDTVKAKEFFELGGISDQAGIHK